jgi:hypothetical protein
MSDAKIPTDRSDRSDVDVAYDALIAAADAALPNSNLMRQALKATPHLSAQDAVRLSMAILTLHHLSGLYADGTISLDWANHVRSKVLAYVKALCGPHVETSVGISAEEGRS